MLEEVGFVEERLHFDRAHQHCTVERIGVVGASHTRLAVYLVVRAFLLERHLWLREACSGAVEAEPCMIADWLRRLAEASANDTAER